MKTAQWIEESKTRLKIHESKFHAEKEYRLTMANTASKDAHEAGTPEAHAHAAVRLRHAAEMHGGSAKKKLLDKAEKHEKEHDRLHAERVAQHPRFAAWSAHGQTPVVSFRTIALGS